jgi:hypothetical protein
MTILTRKEYMSSHTHLVSADPAERAALHRTYYAQFVNQYTVASVVGFIGADALRKSSDQHLNDIPLERWDRAAMGMPMALSFKAAGDSATKAGLVCVAKEAARQWLESQP